MIVSIEHKSRRFLTGIFNNPEALEAYWQELSNPDQFIKVETQLPHYPIYIIEGWENRPFRYTASQAEVMEIVKQCPIEEDEDNVYFNLYRIKEDWRPPMAGTDYMGVLEHYHIDQWHLDILKTELSPGFFGVFDGLLRELRVRKVNLEAALLADPGDLILKNQLQEVKRALVLFQASDATWLDPLEIENAVRIPWIYEDGQRYFFRKGKEANDPASWSEVISSYKEKIEIRQQDVIFKVKPEE